MKRKAIGFLNEWIESAHRLPLVIKGARQVGKTWLVRHFAESIGKKLIEINFEQDVSFATLFDSNQPKQILINLSGSLGIEIDPENCILFLDEIQEVPHLYEKLRWFADDMPELPVITAGSLLEVVVSDRRMSKPVGRINYMYLEPFSFEEFLLASGKDTLCTLLRDFTLRSSIPLHTHNILTALFKDYVFVGGMPAAIKVWVKTQSLNAVSQVHRDLLETYREDFDVYSGRLTAKRLNDVFSQVPRLLGKKFIYREIDKKIRIDSIKKALTLLCKARICHKVKASAANGVPLDVEIRERYFKVLFIDVGLCSSMLKLSYNQIRTTEELDLVNSGGIAEQVVGQLLRTINPLYEDPELYYWLITEDAGNAELDYVIQHRADVVPIEVKAGSAGRLRSLHMFMSIKKRSYAVRIFSGPAQTDEIDVIIPSGESVNYTLHSLPFYLTEQIQRLLED